VGEIKMRADFSYETLKVRDRMEDLGLDGRIILKRNKLRRFRLDSLVSG
jgi:hypothetical protein